MLIHFYVWISKMKNNCFSCWFEMSQATNIGCQMFGLWFRLRNYVTTTTTKKHYRQLERMTCFPKTCKLSLALDRVIQYNVKRIWLSTATPLFGWLFITKKRLYTRIILYFAHQLSMSCLLKMCALKSVFFLNYLTQ